MALQPQNRDISAADGATITMQAKAWKGTPYKLVGPGSILGDGGDCSGSTWRIYAAAKFDYDYQATATFPDYVAAKKKFRELGPDEAMQEGDILYWSNHMAIFSNFANDPDDASVDRVNAKGQHWTQTNDMWTATHPGGKPYGPGKMSYFKPDEPPRVFRYQK
jgi:hypothetical protein